MNKPAISVIIPVYNVAQYLPSCLDSILEQTIDNLEILCINDASPDNSNTILKRHADKDSRITIFRHENNSGLAAARNTGIDAAKGEYIFFLDSDDILFSPDSLSRLYSIAKENAADEIIGGTLRWNEKTGEREYGYHKNYLKKAVNGIIFKDAPFLAGNVIGCNKLLKTSFLKQHSLRFNPCLKKFEDNPFSWKTHLLAGSISICTDTTYLHRLRDSSGPKSLMQPQKIDYLYRTKAADDMLNFLENNQDTNSIRQIIDRYFVLWLQRDIMSIEENQLNSKDRIMMFKLYYQVLSRIPETSLLYFTPIQRELIQLMLEQQYEVIWEKTKTTVQQTDVRKKNKILQNKLDAVYNSSSWRLTAPLRLVAQHIKKNLTQ